MKARSVDPALKLIWCRWEGIKHVWLSNGFPFSALPALNDGIVLAANRVIFLERRNLLQRYVSSLISRQIEFWIGTRQEFLGRLGNIQLRELDPELATCEIKKDREAILRRRSFLEENQIPVMYLVFEDLFGMTVSKDSQFETMNRILAFLGFRNFAREEFDKLCSPFFEHNKYQWASPETYQLIPGIRNFERAVGSYDFGWLFEPELNRPKSELRISSIL